MNTVGKTLDELTYEVDTQRKTIRTIFDNEAAISWQDDGTLTYFSYSDGYPGAYFDEQTNFANNIEDFTSLPRFAQFLRNLFARDQYSMYLLNNPVWRVIEIENDTTTPAEDDDMQLCECAGAGRHRAIEDTATTIIPINLETYRQKRLAQHV